MARIVAQRRLIFDGQSLEPGDTVAYQDAGRPVGGRVLSNLVSRGLVGFVEADEPRSGTVPGRRSQRARTPEDHDAVA